MLCTVIKMYLNSILCIFFLTLKYIKERNKLLHTSYNNASNFAYETIRKCIILNMI